MNGFQTLGKCVNFAGTYAKRHIKSRALSQAPLKRQLVAVARIRLNPASRDTIIQEQHHLYNLQSRQAGRKERKGRDLSEYGIDRRFHGGTGRYIKTTYIIVSVICDGEL